MPDGGGIVAYLKTVAGKLRPQAVDDAGNGLPVVLTGGNVPVTWTAPQTFEADNIKSVTTPMVILENGTAADAVNTEQRSPAVEWKGSNYSAGAAHNMAATLDLEFQTDGSGGPDPMLVLRDTAGSAKLGISFLASNQTQVSFPTLTGVFDGNVDFGRGDYSIPGHPDVLFFENYAVGGGFVFGSLTGEIVIGANGGIEPGTGATQNVGASGNGFKNVINLPDTVANLTPAAAGMKGARAFVTDATLTMTAGIGTVVVGLGANSVPVYCDGAAWRIG